MRFLFIHQNFPAQFRHLLAALLADPAHQVAVVGDAANLRLRPGQHPRLSVFGYSVEGPAGAAAHPYLRDVDGATRRGQTVARTLLAIRKGGFAPDLVLVHPAWGEGLFVKDVFPDAPMLGYFEFFYRSHGSDVNFDPGYPDDLDSQLRLRMRNAVHLITLDALGGRDRGLAPTAWQRAQFPAPYQERIAVVHEGVDTQVVRPDPAAEVVVGGLRLRAGDEVLSYVARNLEPYRGIHSFLRSLPEILRARPLAQVVVVGGDDVSYGRRLPPGQSYRQQLVAELGAQVDWSRVHFVGKLPYADYLKVLQVARAHVYLTYPFVLSWSMLEAMAAGALVIGSDTAPVREVIAHGRNGLLVDFFDRRQLADSVIAALAEPGRHAALAAAGRASVVAGYDLRAHCLPRTLDLLRSMVEP